MSLASIPLLFCASAAAVDDAVDDDADFCMTGVTGLGVALGDDSSEQSCALHDRSLIDRRRTVHAADCQLCQQSLSMLNARASRVVYMCPRYPTRSDAVLRLPAASSKTIDSSFNFVETDHQPPPMSSASTLPFLPERAPACYLDRYGQIRRVESGQPVLLSASKQPLHTLRVLGVAHGR
jgi:hypothetical protein